MCDITLGVIDVRRHEPCELFILRMIKRWAISSHMLSQLFFSTGNRWLSILWSKDAPRQWEVRRLINNQSVIGLSTLCVNWLSSLFFAARFLETRTRSRRWVRSKLPYHDFRFALWKIIRATSEYIFQQMWKVILSSLWLESFPLWNIRHSRGFNENVRPCMVNSKYPTMLCESSEHLMLVSAANKVWNKSNDPQT